MQTLTKVEPTIRKSYTYEEYLALPDDGKLYELVEGELEEMSPPGERHSSIVDNIHAAMSMFVRPRKLGKIYPASSFKFAEKIVRAPDLAFITTERLPQSHHEGPILVVPDLAIEVVSLSDLWSKVEDKILTYQQYGIKLIWVIPPRGKIVLVYNIESGLEPQVVGYNAELDGEDVLPGFKLKVSEIFE